MIKNRMGMNVSEEQVTQMLSEAKDGCTVWSLYAAMIYRAIDENKETHGLIEIIPIKELEEILGENFDGASQLPYFGAITTEKGMSYLENGSVEN